MTARVLPRSEWSRLDGTELAPILASFPDGAPVDVLVVERDGRIVGRWMRLTMEHVEGLWIDPAYRGKGSVARRLWSAMRTLVRSRGAGSVLTGAADDSVRRLLAHAHAESTGECFAVPMGKG